LRKLDLDHLDLRLARLGGKPFGVEPSFRRAAAEIAAANLPDQIAAMLAVIAADRAFAGVVGEIAELGALLSARTALAESVPKLIAEMLNTEQE
jgi:hypothetical protein